MVIKCTCQHESQDRLHGAGMRVHNPGQGANNTIKWRCTVCLKEKDGPAQGYNR